MGEIRELENKDFYNGFLETIKRVNKIDINPTEAKEAYNYIGQWETNTKVFVYVEDDKVLGTATLKIDVRFGRHFARVEDVAVRLGYEKKGIGRKLVEYLIEVSRLAKCYKVILTTEKKNIGFYTKFGFKKDKAICMRINL